MASTTQQEPIIDERVENPKRLAMAGGVLFALGLIAVFLFFVQKDSAEKINMALYAAVLLALGYPGLLYSRSLKKIAILEERLKALEQRAQS